MKKVKVIVERGSDNRFSAYMDYYDLDFGLAGFGSTANDAIVDFYEAYEEEKVMSAKEGKMTPELVFDVCYDRTQNSPYCFADELKQMHLVD